MMNWHKITFIMGLLLMIGFAQSCKNKEPSIIKIYVRSSSNDLVNGAKVVLIGDKNSTPVTNDFTDTIVTNSSGFAYFDMQEHFDAGDKDYEVGVFDIIATAGNETATGKIRARVHTTAVETVRFP